MLQYRFTTRRRLTADPEDLPWGAGNGAATRRRPRLPLIVREPEAGWYAVRPRATVTVAAVREQDAAEHPEWVAERLAEVAAGEALLVVLGFDGRALRATVEDGLCRRLPRRDVVTVPVGHVDGRLLHDAATVEELLDAGRLPLVVTGAGAMLDVTAAIASYLRADRVLRVLPGAVGADLCPVWQRRPEPDLN